MMNEMDVRKDPEHGHAPFEEGNPRGDRKTGGRRMNIPTRNELINKELAEYEQTIREIFTPEVVGHLVEFIVSNLTSYGRCWDKATLDREVMTVQRLANLEKIQIKDYVAVLEPIFSNKDWKVEDLGYCSLYSEPALQVAPAPPMDTETPKRSWWTRLTGR
jgi:hypothetical protein